MMLKQSKFMVMVVFTLLLSACNAEDDSQSSSYQPSENIEAPIALDNFSQVVLTGEKTVSLEQSVLDPQGLRVYLTSVVSLSNDCDDPNFDSDALSFEIDKEASDTCYYQYTVQNVNADGSKGKSSTADTYVLISETEVSDFLPPISETTSVGEELEINLNEELSDVDNIGDYILDSETILVGDGTVTAVDSELNTLTYDAPTTKGAARIFYSMSNETGTVTQTGYIDVTVSESANSGVTAENFEAPIDDETGQAIGINSYEEITIDVSGHVSDPDGDDLQLIQVSSFNSQAEIVDADALTFTFIAFTPGNYNISYYVTDNRGSLASGIVQVTVDEVGQDWQDITLDDGTFYSAPWDETGASVAKLDYASSYTETIGTTNYNIVTFDWQTAKNYCLSKSQLLPDRALLNKLYTDRLDTSGIKETDLWPTDQPYWTSEEGELDGELAHYAVNLADGEEILTDTPSILTCVNPANLEVEVLTAQDDIYQTLSSEDQQLHQISVHLEPNGSSSAPIEGQQIYAYSFDDGVFFENSVGITDSSGYADFNVASTTDGDKDIYFRYNSINHQTVNFKANELQGFYLDSATSYITPDTPLQINAYGTFTSVPDTESIIDPTLFTWTSSDSKVVVDDKGVVTGTDYTTEPAIVTATYTGENVSSEANTSDTIEINIVDTMVEGDLDGYYLYENADILIGTKIDAGYYEAYHRELTEEDLENIDGDPEDQIHSFEIRLVNKDKDIKLVDYDPNILTNKFVSNYTISLECNYNTTEVWPVETVVQVSVSDDSEPATFIFRCSGIKY